MNPSRPVRYSPALLAAQVSRLQPLLPACVQAVVPMLHGWVLELKGQPRTISRLLLSFQPGALGIYLADADEGTTPPAYEPPPLAQRWVAQLEGRTLCKAFALPQEPIAVLGFDRAGADEQKEPRTHSLVLELFGASGNCVEIELGEGKKAVEEVDWLDGPILNVFHPNQSQRREVAVGSRYTLPQLTSEQRRDPDETIDAAKAEAEFLDNLQAHWLEQAVAIVAKPLRQEQSKLTRRINSLETQITPAADAERLLQEGRYLQAHPQRGARGFTRIDPQPEAAYWNLDKVITVLSHLTLAENAQKLFQRAQRMRKGAAYARTTLPGLKEQAAELEKKIATLLALGQLDSWEEAVAQLPPAERLNTTTGPALPSRGREKRGDKDAPGFVRRYRSSDGWIIDVGKSAKDNHRLTFQTAHGNDTLFHISSVPGAHVLVRCPGKLPKGESPQLPAATLLEAARLCLYFSRNRALEGEVVYALRKNCRPGSRPGQVQIAKPNYLRVKADAAAVKRLLDQRV